MRLFSNVFIEAPSTFTTNETVCKHRALCNISKEKNTIFSQKLGTKTEFKNILKIQKMILWQKFRYFPLKYFSNDLLRHSILTSFLRNLKSSVNFSLKIVCCFGYRKTNQLFGKHVKNFEKFSRQF